MRIVKASEPLQSPPLVIAIYGEPGSWKTSIASTAQNPILLDFDRGAHRTAFRKDVVPVESWAEVAQISAADLEHYDTVVVDTAGRALDSLSLHLIRGNPKLGRNPGELSLQGYGALKAAFTGWVKMIRDLGKHVVFIAHAREDKNDDRLITRPDLQGGSRDELYKVADAMAFLNLVGTDRYLHFAPSDRWQAKDPAGIGNVKVPPLTEAPDYLAGLIARISHTIAMNAQQSRSLVSQLAKIREGFAELETADQVNDRLDYIKGLDRSISVPAYRALQDHAKSLGLAYDKASGGFMEPAEPAGPDEGDQVAADASA